MAKNSQQDNMFSHNDSMPGSLFDLAQYYKDINHTEAPSPLALDCLVCLQLLTLDNQSIFFDDVVDKEVDDNVPATIGLDSGQTIILPY